MRYIKVTFSCYLCGCDEEIYYKAPDFYCDKDIELELLTRLDDYLYDIDSFIREDDYDDPEEYEQDKEDLIASATFEWKPIDPLDVLGEKYEDTTFYEL